MSIAKRVDEARRAFRERDLDQAARAHAPERIASAHREAHGSAGDQYIGEMVYGGLDGIITTFAVVSGVAGAQLGSGIILVLGLANLLADGLSMATGAYLSSKSEQEYYEREWEREMWEVEHFPDAERAELYAVYRDQDYSEEEARALVEIQSRKPDRWVRTMMVDELGMMAEERNPLRIGLATLISFVVAGSVPLLVYLLGLLTPIAPQSAFAISVALSAAALFGLGAAKVLVTGRNLFKSGLEMLLVGGLAAAVAYLVGALLKSVAG